MAINSKKRKIIATILGSVSGFSGMAVTGAIIGYDAAFPRYNYPDYAVTPGIYTYERIKKTLPREEFFFDGDECKLKGYYYKTKNSKGLVVIGHGFHAGADDYLPIIDYLVKSGFNVFAFDYQGTYGSEGDGTEGMCQSAKDMDHALIYVQSQPRLKRQPLFLLGHSWGGYAAASNLEFHPEVKACALIAPMYNGFTMMLDKSEEYVGKLGKMPKPIFDVYQKILFGKYVDCNGVKGINSTQAPVLIAHGVDDKILKFDEHQSIISHKSEIKNPNVTYYIGYGVHGDHNNIWHSNAAALYQMEVESRMKYLEIEKGRALTYEEKVEFYKTVDHRLYSEVNAELMNLIIQTFTATL